jgi:dihydroxyacetone kinase-like protein
MTNEGMRRWLERLVAVLHENAAYLTQLDSDIGDADHGINMDRGFQAVSTRLQDGMDISTLLKTTAMTLISTVGGASGPLYGTAFLRASAAVAGKQELTGPDFVALLDAFLNGIVQRGKASPGEKTMIDALTPALAAARAAAESGASLAEVSAQASQAAEEGMKATIPMLAKKGRASYLGERSIGHQDPGATSSWLILRTFAEVSAQE